MDKIPQIQTREVENLKLTPGQENERDEMQKLVNQARELLNVDEKGAIIGSSDINGEPIYPTQKDYEWVIDEIIKKNIKERDEKQEMINMMRVLLNVDQNGAIVGKNDKNGKPEYPTEEQYSKALTEIEELKRKVEGKKINEKLISKIRGLILAGGKKVSEFLSADFKDQKKAIDETVLEMINNDAELKLKILKECGIKYGKDEIDLYRQRILENLEEKYFEDIK